MPLSPTTRKALFVPACIFGIGLLTSWIAGQCSGYRAKGLPRVVPVQVDPGTPTPGPIAESPTVLESVQTAAPELSKSDVLALAAKYGLVLATKSARPQRQSTAAEPELTAAEIGLIGGDRPANRLSERRYPLFLAEETFRHEASGVSADVAAILPDDGAKIDLRASWHEWTPPAPAQCGKDRTYFGNESRWQKFVGVGGVATEAGAGPGLFGGFGYRGWRVGAVTMGADVIGGATSTGDGFLAGGLTVSW